MLMKKHARYFRVAMTVNADLMETIFDLLKHEDVHDLRMVELNEDGTVPGKVIAPVRESWVRPTSDDRGAWARKAWPALKPVFDAANGHPIFYRDERIASALIGAGMKPSTATPLLSMLVRHGYLKRARRGEYMLP